MKYWFPISKRVIEGDELSNSVSMELKDLRRSLSCPLESSVRFGLERYLVSRVFVWIDDVYYIDMKNLDEAFIEVLKMYDRDR